ncbi:glycosyltransferase family 2 protein [Bacillus sp. sid0103]|uniref:glycosyltransferase family A protein n=1 Tax=Bacillus sp. sid0103 TaxID=2856337 RepID=UPI001C45672E|nr:glycosyltransferase family A protein [Bacillus sp. sid0103]MBV7508967.1 glycosyltransferase family 2 protein [Bacillus sp. sid0103]
MNLQVLISTMHQTDHSLLGKMNIQTDAIIVNQCDRNEFEEFEYKGKLIRILSFEERGVGLSRNNALMRANNDICLFADDDVKYVDGYENIIVQAFIENPNVDIMIFNVISTNPERPLHTIKKNSRVRLYNCLKYGAVSIAARTEKLKEANVYFSLLFGGGAKYSAGEDSLFIVECIQKGLRICTCPQVIGYASQEDSTWFEGYTDKYFFDKGAFFACLSRKMYWLYCIMYSLKWRKMLKENGGIYHSYKNMINGARSVLKN